MSPDDRPWAWVSAPGLWRIRGLEAFVPEYLLQRLPSPGTRAVIGWGRKGTSWVGRTWAERAQVPYLALEDGFLRSIGLGEVGAAPHSLLIDDLGVHHDARRPSRLETLIREPDGWFDSAMEARSRVLIQTLRDIGLSKTSMGRLHLDLPPASGPRVLIVDQTAGDASIAGGLADGDSFLAMADAAHAATGGGQMLVRRHPATVAGLKRGCLPAEALTGAIPVDDVLPCRMGADQRQPFRAPPGCPPVAGGAGGGRPDRSGAPWRSSDGKAFDPRGRSVAAAAATGAGPQTGGLFGLCRLFPGQAGRSPAPDEQSARRDSLLRLDRGSGNGGPGAGRPAGRLGRQGGA